MEYLKLIENGEKNSPERLKIMIFTEGCECQ